MLPAALSEVPLVVLGLPARGHGALLREGIATVQQLVNHSSVELMRVPDFGRTSLAHVRHALAERSLALRDEQRPNEPDWRGQTTEARLERIERKLDLIWAHLCPP